MGDTVTPKNKAVERGTEDGVKKKRNTSKSVKNKAVERGTEDGVKNVVKYVEIGEKHVENAPDNAVTGKMRASHSRQLHIRPTRYVNGASRASALADA